ncbi:hypothetical protein BU15DRAFT_64266 [Melanogaster broomeanus]|nr:hypothetical protein BU15DRAFT_64266 [Melanogaster broomeanus]
MSLATKSYRDGDFRWIPEAPELICVHVGFGCTGLLSEHRGAPEFRHNASTDLIRQRAAEKGCSREASKNAKPGTIKHMQFTFSLAHTFPVAANVAISKLMVAPATSTSRRGRLHSQANDGFIRLCVKEANVVFNLRPREDGTFKVPDANPSNFPNPPRRPRQWLFPATSSFGRRQHANGIVKQWHRGGQLATATDAHTTWLLLLVDSEGIVRFLVAANGGAAALNGLFGGLATIAINNPGPIENLVLFVIFFPRGVSQFFLQKSQFPKPHDTKDRTHHKPYPARDATSTYHIG